MLRWGFSIASATVGLFHLQAGLRGTLAPGAGWDAGVMDLFVAFWFALGAVGFWRREFWLVTPAAVALASLTGLELFIDLVGGWHRFDGLAEGVRQGLVVGLARLGFLLGGWIYALAAHRPGGARGQDGAS